MANSANSARALVTGIVDDAHRLLDLELERVQREAKEIVVRNLWAFGLLIFGTTHVSIVFLVIIPLTIVRESGYSVIAVLVWILLDGIGGAVLALVAYRLLRMPDLKATRSARAALETKIGSFER